MKQPDLKGARSRPYPSRRRCPRLRSGAARSTPTCTGTTRRPGSPDELSLTWDHDGYTALTQVESKSAVDAPQDIIDQRFFAIITDQIGTPTELVDETGRIAWRSRSPLWGTTVWNRDATAHTPLRFPGQYFDAETQLHHNYFRTYDPETARYLTLDPLGLGSTRRGCRCIRRRPRPGPAGGARQRPG